MATDLPAPGLLTRFLLRPWIYPSLIETLAAAYAEAGLFDRAVEWQRRAVQSAPPESESRHRLEPYKKGH